MDIQSNYLHKLTDTLEYVEDIIQLRGDKLDPEDGNKLLERIRMTLDDYYTLKQNEEGIDYGC